MNNCMHLTITPTMSTSPSTREFARASNLDAKFVKFVGRFDLAYAFWTKISFMRLCTMRIRLFAVCRMHMAKAEIHTAKTLPRPPTAYVTLQVECWQRALSRMSFFGHDKDFAVCGFSVGRTQISKTKKTLEENSKKLM